MQDEIGFESSRSRRSPLKRQETENIIRGANGNNFDIRIMYNGWDVNDIAGKILVLWNGAA